MDFVFGDRSVQRRDESRGNGDLKENEAADIPC
jgi:hypothetical protein